MRVLSEEEMDSVFGGDGIATTNLDKITVKASYATFNSSQYFYYGPSYSENGGGSGGSAPASAYYALPPSSIPSPAKVRCMASAAAVPGHGPVDSYELRMINSHAYTANDGSGTKMFVSNSYYPPNFTQIRGEVYVKPDSHQPNGAWAAGFVTMYADAFIATTDGTRSAKYYNDAGQLETVGKPLGAVSAIESAVLVAAHEYQHVYQFLNPDYLGGRDKEADAETFAIKALERYRAGNKGNCG